MYYSTSHIYPSVFPSFSFKRNYWEIITLIHLALYVFSKTCFLPLPFSDKFLLVVTRMTIVCVRPCTRSLENAMISDPNIPETGEQATRALHSISDDECCFHVCSEDTKDGICTRCKEPWKHGKFQDPATAPQCEMNPPQSGSTGISSYKNSKNQRMIKTIVRISRRVLWKLKNF